MVRLTCIVKKMKAVWEFAFLIAGTMFVFILPPMLGELDSSFPSLSGARTNPCLRARLGVSPKSPGDNGYRIQIAGDPPYYKPGELYQITLQGTRTQFYFRKFIGFMLTVSVKEEENYISSRPDAGSFHLLGDSISRFSEECPNAVVEASYIPKDEVQVAWRAPSPGFGCVVFRATIQENPERWYVNEGNLVLEFCEGQENLDERGRREGCCACGRAEYELRFKGLWSKETHPKDFPTNEWLIHFSDIIGASHMKDFKIWEDQGYASEGVKDVAVKGATRKLELELSAQPNKVHSVFKARGLWPPAVNGITFTRFSVSDQHHLVSLLTMLSPSSDWILGVDSLDLCLRNCSWVTEEAMDLYLWDAGVADGVTYVTRRQPTVPQGIIQRITSSSYPDDPASPFYDPSGAPTRPFAHLTLRRLQVSEQPCGEHEPVSPNTYPDAEDNDVAISNCPVSEWGEFSSCSVTCGDGFRVRSRQYLDPKKADMNFCNINLMDKQPCQEICVGNVSCQTTEWSEWSECSVTCGKGFRTRNRRFIEYRARKLCPVEVTQKDPCMGMKAECEDSETLDPLCEITTWSVWSPCTVTCGEGVRVRTRIYFNPTAVSVCNVDLMQKISCRGEKISCALDMAEAKEICMLPKKVGPCRGYFPRWHFDTRRLTCMQFVYGGCRGNRNNFEVLRDCLETCKVIFTVPADVVSSTVSTAIASESQEKSPIDCMVTPWSGWTACSHTCGTGRKERRRMIKLSPENGGSPCPEKLIQRRRCQDIPSCPEPVVEFEDYSPVDCVVTPWSEWTPCSHTCGSGQTERHRMIKVTPKNGGKPCPEKLAQRRRCSDIPTCSESGAEDKIDVDCVLSSWSEWSPCSKTCGDYAFRERIKMITQHPRNNGAPCDHRVERRYCRLQPCPPL